MSPYLQRTQTILQSIYAEVQRTERAKVFSNELGKALSTGQARQAKDKRGRAATDAVAKKARWVKARKLRRPAKKTFKVGQPKPFLDHRKA